MAQLKSHIQDSGLSYLYTMTEMVINEIRDAYTYRYVTIAYVETTIRQKYRRSILGFFWSLLAPIMQFGAIGLIFYLTRVPDIPNYFSFAFFAAVGFNQIAATLNSAPYILVGNESYIKKIFVPKLTFVLNTACFESANFILSFVGLCALGILLGQVKLSWAIFFIPVSTLITLVLLVGLSSVIAVGTVYFRDLTLIMPVLTQVSFFITPIFYRPENLGPKLSKLVYFNPLTYYVELYRQPIYSGSLPSLPNIVFCSILSFLCLFLGLWLLKKFDNKIVFKL